METKQRYTFKKDEKLKSRKTIEQLWQFTELAKAPVQTGFAVSSKHFKKAVDRNRIKRLMREAYRLQKNELQTQLMLQRKQLAVFIIYVGNELPDHDFIVEKMNPVLTRLIKITNENLSANT